MKFERLRNKVYDANMQLVDLKLVEFTWGNVSELDWEGKVFGIKPSGVPYNELRPVDIVICDLDGKVVDGNLLPSSDTPTHRALYKAFNKIGGITHTHSTSAVAFATAGMDIPTINTTAADTFYGDIPCSRQLSQREVENNYEYNTGKVIEETFCERHLDYMEIPGIIVNQHGPFAWGSDSLNSVYNAKVLEIVADMNIKAAQISRDVSKKSLPGYLLKKHYERKHGKNAYYGQKRD